MGRVDSITTGAVSDLTAAELTALDAGSWYAPRFAGARVPLFADFLDVIRSTRGAVTALVELKGRWEPADV